MYITKACFRTFSWAFSGRYVVLLDRLVDEVRKKQPHWRRKKPFFMMTVHHLTHRTLHRRNRRAFWRVWQIVIFGRHRKVERSLDSLYRAKRRVNWEIKPIFAKEINSCSFYHVDIKHPSIIFRSVNLPLIRYQKRFSHAFFRVNFQDICL